MLKIKDGKLHGDNFAFSLPNNLMLEFVKERQESFLQFLNPELLYYVEICFTKSRKSSAKWLGAQIQEMECQKNGNLFLIERDGKKGVAAFFSSPITNYYEEVYDVSYEKSRCILSIMVWRSLSDDPKIRTKLCKLNFNDEKELTEFIDKHYKKIPISEILDRPEMKELFNSLSFEN